MGFVPGCPIDDVGGYGPLTPIAVVLHRTYGQWAGDYSVIRSGKLCQVLIGKEQGQWVQFASTDVVHYHCNGANFRAFGIELTGTNEDPLTPWQVARLGDVLRYANEAHGIPLTFLDPDAVPPASVWVNGGGFRGVISHVSVRTDDGSSQHTDAVTGQAFAVALGDDTSTRIPEDMSDMIYFTVKAPGSAEWPPGVLFETDPGAGLAPKRSVGGARDNALVLNVDASVAQDWYQTAGAQHALLVAAAAAHATGGTVQAVVDEDAIATKVADKLADRLKA
jgi:hypothetical protein